MFKTNESYLIKYNNLLNFVIIQFVYNVSNLTCQLILSNISIYCTKNTEIEVPKADPGNP